MAHEFDLLVIGGGSGGVRCARIAAGHGARVGIVEARHWGGTCVNLGCVPKKIMVQASEYGLAAHDAQGFGWSMPSPAHDWQHDWRLLIANKDREIARLNAAYTRILENAGVRVFEGQARFLDAHTIQVESGPLVPDATPRRLSAERIVIATGGVPSPHPPIEGGEFGIVSDQAFHLPERPRRVTVIGGGYIGVEFCGIFAGLGSEVGMVMRQPLPLRGFDGELRAGLDEPMAERGIVRHAGRLLHRVEREGDALALSLDDGTRIVTDLLFYAVGREPNVQGLGLEHTGVRQAEGGRVVTYEGAATDEPGIYAIGDVTNRLNLTPVAIAEGHMLADRLFGSSPRAWDLDRVAKAVFFSPPLASVGLTEEAAAARGRTDIYVERFKTMRHSMSGRDRRTLVKLVVDHASQVVLGAHMIGEDAPEILQGLAIAVSAGLTKQDFDHTVGIHPSSAEEFVTLRTRTRTVGETDAGAGSEAALPG